MKTATDTWISPAKGIYLAEICAMALGDSRAERVRQTARDATLVHGGCSIRDGEKALLYQRRYDGYALGGVLRPPL